MRLPVRLPQFGEAAAEATIMTWLVNPGTAVASEQELCEVQTEKSVLTVAAPAAGTLIEVCAKPGTKPVVGDVLAWLEVAEGTVVPDAAGPVATTLTGAAPAVASSATPRPAGVRLAGVSRGDFLSPRLRAQLETNGMLPADLAAITGTGAGGRVTAADLERHLGEGDPMSPLRQAVASNMIRSWARPLATAARPVKIDPLLTHRRTIAGRPSATVYCLRALALALKEDDRLGCRLVGTRLTRPTSIDLAVAVEVDDGVLTPVIRQVDQLDLAKLTAAVDAVIEQARLKRVADTGEAVSTVTNYGTFGLTWATAIPQPGQTMILGIGAVKYVPDWNPALKTWDRAREAELTLTFDHRIADGGAAARLLLKVAELLEHPERL
jgi:pyruvate/2-oxoglutarate dehydrogenase complex dihydrolipoamide acyltransferase (E2) component